MDFDKPLDLGAILEYAHLLYHEFLLKKSLTRCQSDMFHVGYSLNVYEIERAYILFQNLIKKGEEDGKDKENES